MSWMSAETAAPTMAKKIALADPMPIFILGQISYAKILGAPEGPFSLNDLPRNRVEFKLRLISFVLFHDLTASVPFLCKVLLDLWTS